MKVGFIGLGVMGEPMCANLRRKSGLTVLAHDMRNEPVQRLAEHGVQGASLQEIARRADVILLSLPDGKAMRATLRGKNPVHLLAALDHARGVVVAQVSVNVKTNEIPMFSVLLDQIPDLKGTLITADALHAQTGHMEYLHKRGADLLVCVKGNQPTLRKNVISICRYLFRSTADSTLVAPPSSAHRGNGRRKWLAKIMWVISCGKTESSTRSREP